MQRVDKVLERVRELPFSPVAFRILEAARDDRVGAREIARIIAQDQAFTARLLKVANSPHYGQTRTITTVTQAVPVLGINTIVSLALALVSFSSIAHDENAILTIRDLWEHSMGCAFWSRELAKRAGHSAVEESFIAGLLHDMGKALFYRFFKTEFLQAIHKARSQAISLLEAERALIGADHAYAGAAVARQWYLPPVLIHSIEFHHEPTWVPDKMDDSIRKTVAVVHAADVLAEQCQIGSGGECRPLIISPEIWDFLGLDLESCNDLVEPVLAEMNEFRKIFDLSSGVKSALPRASVNGKPRPRLGAADAAPGMGNGKMGASSEAPDTSKMDAVAQVMQAGKQLALLAGLDDLCPNIAVQAMGLLKADAAHVFLPEEDFLSVAGTAGLAELHGQRLPVQGSLAGWVAKMGETLVLQNVDKAQPCWEKDFFATAGFRSHVFLPAHWAGKRLAVLSVHSRKERLWSSDEIALFDTFAEFAAVALENARLYREAEDKASVLAGVNRNLEEALKVKSKFLATISHELRSPLVVISGYSSLITERTFGALPDGLADAVDKINKQAKILLTAITHLIEISQMDAGTFAVRYESFDLADLLDEVAAEMPGLIGPKPIAFQVQYSAGSYPIMTDRARFQQILRHLLDNAVKFTDAGTILLGARACDDGAEIVVEDTGIGIQPEHQTMIFDGFRQVDDENNRCYEGMGLGLYLSRRVLELLGGKISVESRASRGTRFRVWLPCSASTTTPSVVAGG
jgi:putative nucleotidyltransferase with HDIG domain